MLALSAAAREIGLRVAAFGIHAPRFEPGQEVLWSLPSGARPGPQPASGLYPPLVSVRLPIRHPGRTRRQFINAIIEAGTVEWYRPTEPGVHAPLSARWPYLRTRGPRLEGLAERLDAVIEEPGPNPVQWLYQAGAAAGETAFCAGAPVIISGYPVHRVGVLRGGDRQRPRRLRAPIGVDRGGPRGTPSQRLWTTRSRSCCAATASTPAPQNMATRPAICVPPCSPQPNTMPDTAPTTA